MSEYQANAKRKNPFKPGHGLMPPILAGRAVDQSYIKRQLSYLAMQDSVNSITMYGPRGMGKTALLNWIAAECETAPGAFWVVKTSLPRLLKSEKSLLQTLDGRDKALTRIETRYLGEVMGEVSGRGGIPRIAEGESSSGGKIAIERATTSEVVDARMARLEETLTAACGKTPLVLLVDEAHAITNIDLALYQEFLNLMQGVAGDAPCLFVLAGTPDLPDALKAAEATFIDRAKAIGVGLIDEGEAARAIREPLEAGGIGIDKDALAEVVRHSQRYPYFIQLWGEALWNHSVENNRPQLSLRDALAVADLANEGKTKHYKGRYDEVSRDPRLKAAAYAAARSFAEADYLAQDGLWDAIRSALTPLVPAKELDDSVSANFDALRRLGYLWCSPQEDVIRPGIPSMMTYTREKIAAQSNTPPSGGMGPSR